MVKSIAQLFNVLLLLALSAQVTLAAPTSSQRIGSRQCKASESIAPSDTSSGVQANESIVPINAGVNNGKSVDEAPVTGPSPSPVDAPKPSTGPDPASKPEDEQTPNPKPAADPTPDAPDAPETKPTPPAEEYPTSSGDTCVSNMLPSLARPITFHQPFSDILKHTTDAIRVLTGQVNDKTGQFKQGAGEFFVWASSNGWTSIAINDRLNDKREFENDVSNGLQLMADHYTMGGEKWGVPLVNEFNDDSGWAGLAAVEAYDAYGADKYLKWAVGVFDFLRAHGYVDQAAVDAGYLVGTKAPDVKIQKDCNGKSLVGGVAWKNVPDGGGLNAVSTGNFALLAAELCRITGDQKKYCDPAVQSMRFMDDHLLMDDGLLKDHIGSDTCEGKEWRFTYNVGLYIATYASLGKTLSNPDFTAKAEAMILASLKTPEWNTNLGVLKQGSGPWDVSDDGLGFKSIYVRYLQKAHDLVDRQDIKDAIVQYVNIQYDSLVWMASDSQENPVNFGRSWNGWEGKRYEGSTVHSQIAALDALNAIQLNPPSAFSSQVDGKSVTTSTQDAPRCA